MDNLQQKHEERGMCFCKECHHNRMERILKETEQLRVNRLILQNKNIEMKKGMEQSMQFATIQELKDGYDESTDELVVITPKCHNVTFQLNESNQQVNNQVESDPIKICNEVMEPVQQIPLDKDMKLDVLHNYNQEDMDETSHNNEDYSDLWSPQDNKKVPPNNWDYYLGFKMKPQQRIIIYVKLIFYTMSVLYQLCCN